MNYTYATMYIHRLVWWCHDMVYGEPVAQTPPRSTILITGAGSGLGYETAKILAKTHAVYGTYAHSIDVPKLIKINVIPVPSWDTSSIEQIEFDMMIANAAIINADYASMCKSNYSEHERLLEVIKPHLCVSICDDSLFTPSDRTMSIYMQSKTLLCFLTRSVNGTVFFPGQMRTRLFASKPMYTTFWQPISDPATMAEQLVFVVKSALTGTLTGTTYTGYHPFS